MEKRRVCSLTPYYKKDGTYYFFLQMRDANAAHNPNRLGLFGGGLEGSESPKDAIIREIKEELNFDLKDPVLFCHFEFMNMIQDAYYLEVDENFQSEVTVLEGEYGKFLSQQEIIDNSLVTPEGRVVVLSLLEYLEEI